MISCDKCRIPSIEKVEGVQYCPDCGQGHEIEKVGEHYDSTSKCKSLIGYLEEMMNK